MKNLIFSLIALLAMYTVVFGGPVARWTDDLLVGSLTDEPVWVAVNPAPEGTPQSQLVVHSGIEQARGPIADSPAGPVFIKDVLLLPRKPETHLSSFGDPLDDVAACTPDMASGAEVYHVFGERSEAKMSFAMLPQSSLEYALEQFLNSWTSGADLRYGYPNWRHTEPSVAHVVVTDTQTPVHLVLQNAGTAMLWHVHAADGADIAGITILGGMTNGIAGVTPDVPVQVINRRGLFKCGMIPHAGHVAALPSSVETQLIEGPLDEDRYKDRWSIDDAANYVYQAGVPDWLKNVHRKAKFETWFVDHFGQTHSTNVIGFSDAPALVSLAGPLPDQPLAYRALSDQVVRTGQDVSALGLGEGSLKEDFRKLIEDTARDLAGGTLEQLRGAKAEL